MLKSKSKSAIQDRVPKDTEASPMSGRSLWLAEGLCLNRCERMGRETMKPRLDQIDLVCADMDKTLAFYRLLGVPQPRVWRTKTGAHHGHVELPGGLSLQFNSPA